MLNEDTRNRLRDEMIRDIAWAYRMDDKGNIIFVNQPKTKATT